MKRIQAACLFQTLLFSQKEEMGYTREQALGLNRKEAAHYKDLLDRSRVRYRITEQTEQSDGSILMKVRRQYNDRADVQPYFDL